MQCCPHAQRKRLETLNNEEGIEGRQRSPDVAEQSNPGLDRVGDGTERFDRFRPDRSVITGIWRIQRRLPFRMSRPVEIPAVDDETADRVSVSAEIFRRRVNDDCCAVLKRFCENRRRRIVHDERNTEWAADCCNFGNREDRELRVWKCFGVISAGPFIGRAPKILRVNRVDEPNLDSLVFEGMGKKIPCPSIKIGRTHNVVARTRKILNCKGGGCLTGCKRQCGDATFKGSNALFQHVSGGIHDARIDVA